MKQPEALRLAAWLDGAYEGDAQDAAAELRRQHALILEMREALKSVNAAIYMDDAGQLRLSRSFDERVIDVAILRALNE